MLTSNPIILQLLALLHAHGVHDVVVCPGSRDASIVHSIIDCGLFAVHPITDERSAGFFAIGLAQHYPRPVAVIVTSGSALANLYPAACEAYYQQIPLILISADRPAQWVGQMDGQTMPQHGALGQMVRKSVNLATDNLWHANRLINEAILETMHHVCGPVHINIPVSEPIYDFTTKALPQTRVIRRIQWQDSIELETARERVSSYHRILILIGQMPYGDFRLQQLDRSYPNIVAENLSNLTPNDFTNSYLVDWGEVKPFDLVITMGGHLTDKRMKQWMRANPPREHWHVSPDGAIADLFCCQSLAIEAEALDFLMNMPCLKRKIQLPLRQREESPLLRRFFSLLPYHSCVHLSNSTAIRMAQLSELDVMHIQCNRGINGIEGSMSTAVGYATAVSGMPVYLVIGDLSFFYDQNALWNTHLPENLHILLINNGGGAIFNTLPLPDNSVSRDAIMGNHHLTAHHVAEQYGLRYLSGEDQMEEFVSSRQPVILEI